MVIAVRKAIARLRQHQSHRLPSRSGDLQNLFAAGLMHIKPQRHSTDHSPCLDRRPRADRCPSAHAVSKRIYKRRKETLERSFADAKQLHGHREARFRGLLAVACQCLLAAAAHNVKKIALARPFLA